MKPQTTSDPGAASASPDVPVEDEGGAVRPQRLLRHVTEIELEAVLQSLYCVRQDLEDLTAERPDPRAVASTISTVKDLTASVRILLALLRSFSPAAATEHGLCDRTSNAFAIMRPDGHVLYMNASISTLFGRDHHVVAATPFAARSWADRDQVRRHLRRAETTGVADEVFEVVRGDDSTIAVRVETERMDVVGEGAVLLMTLDPDHVHHPAATAG